MTDPNVAFAAHLDALARVPDPEARCVKGLLTAVVQDWSLLAVSGTPTFECDGATLWVRGSAVPLAPARRAGLNALEAALREHGVGGAQLTGPIDRVAVLALLRSVRSVPNAAPREALQHWLSTHGGRALILLPPRPAANRDGRDALRAVFAAWAALDAAAEPSASGGTTPALEAAVRGLVDCGLDDPRVLPVLLAFSGALQHRALTMATLSLVLGIRLGLPRGALADLTLSALEVAFLPANPDSHSIARRIAARATGHLGLTDARVTLSLWGAASTPAHDRPRSPSGSLFERIVALAGDADSLLRSDGLVHAQGQGPLLPDEAMARLQAQAGRRHDPGLVDALVSCLGRYPVGSAVLLDNGEIALVCRAPGSAEQVGRPTVRVVVDRTGIVLGGSPLIDLSQPARARTRILATLDPARLGLSVADAVLG